MGPETGRHSCPRYSRGEERHKCVCVDCKCVWRGWGFGLMGQQGRPVSWLWCCAIISCRRLWSEVQKLYLLFCWMLDENIHTSLCTEDVCLKAWFSLCICDFPFWTKPGRSWVSSPVMHILLKMLHCCSNLTVKTAQLYVGPAHASKECNNCWHSVSHYKVYLWAICCRTARVGSRLANYSAMHESPLPPPFLFPLSFLIVFMGSVEPMS